MGRVVAVRNWWPVFGKLVDFVCLWYVLIVTTLCVVGFSVFWSCFLATISRVNNVYSHRLRFGGGYAKAP